MDLSIIIVSYNTRDLTISCIRSILDSDMSGLNYEIIVVDNASSDDSQKEIKKHFLEIKLIESEVNLGYSKANNIGIKEAKGDFILLLNPDTVVEKDTIKTCFKYIKRNSNIGALGCKVVLPDGRLDKACKRSYPTPVNSFFYFSKIDRLFPSSKLIGAYNLTYLPEDEVNDVECLVGAFMMIRKNVLNQVGLFDEDYFLYGEDIDLCYRMNKTGWRLVYYPVVQITHYKSASGLASKNKEVIKHFYNSMILFYNKNYKDKYSKLTRYFVIIAIKLMMKIKLLFSADN